MKRNFIYGLVLCSLLLVIVACGGVAYVPYAPTADDSQKSGVAVENLEKGKALFVANCDKCHGLKAPENYTKVKWASVMPRMQKKSKLSNEDGQLILQYVQTRAKL